LNPGAIDLRSTALPVRPWRRPQYPGKDKHVSSIPLNISVIPKVSKAIDSPSKLHIKFQMNTNWLIVHVHDSLDGYDRDPCKYLYLEIKFSAS